MAVVIETTLGDVTVDLFIEQRPRTCLNFMKLCKMKYYNFNLFHTIQHGFIAQTGDPSGEGNGGESVYSLLEGKEKRYFACETMPKIRHKDAGLLSMVCLGDNMVGSQFFFTLGPDLDSLDGIHCVIGVVTEGHDILRKLNEIICDESNRPYRDVRITHTVILDDPFPDPPGLREPSRSPSPSTERLANGRIAPDEEIDETKGKNEAEIAEMIAEREAKARATILEMVGDLPDADAAPPENVLFVCKLNPVTTDEDLEIIFSRFGKIICCEVIRDKKTGDSLQYAFIEFEDKKSCEQAYFKMDNVLIDDRRIHVDFSQSVAKLKWRGRGKGVIHVDGSNDRSIINELTNKKDKYVRKLTNKDRDRRSRSKSPRRIESSRKQYRSPTRETRSHQVNSRNQQRYERSNKSPRRDQRSQRSPIRDRNARHRNEKSTRSPKRDSRSSHSPERRTDSSRSTRRRHDVLQHKSDDKDGRNSKYNSNKINERKSESNGKHNGNKSSSHKSSRKTLTPPPMEIQNSNKKSNVTKVRPKIYKKRKQSSTTSSSTDSSSSSSSETSSSSDSEPKKKRKKRKKSSSSSSSSTTSSTSSTSSSDTTDSDRVKKKRRKNKK